MAGGTRHLLGDVLRSLQPAYLAQTADAVASNVKGAPRVNLASMKDNASSWEELAVELKSKQTPEERKFRTNLENGQGLPSALATKRLFGGAKEPRVTLYRDSAAWCPYCQKLWIALEEKKVPYEIVKVDMRCYGNGKPSAFLSLQPNGNLPCAVIDGKVIGESNEIIDAIDQIGARGTPQLRPPADSEAGERLASLCEDGRNSLERRLYSQWLWWLTGVRKPVEYKTKYEEILDEVENALADAPNGGPFFLGKDISLVDIRFIPFIERQVASFAYFKGYNARDPAERPFLSKWLAAMEKRPSYQVTKSDFYTHAKALPPQLSATCNAEAGCEQMRDTIEFLSIGNPFAQGDEEWREPGWDWCSDSPKARREAAERIIYNWERIVMFASRGAGIIGLPASAAPLADPRATSNTEASVAVDLFLRHTVHSLLQGGTSNSSTAVADAAALLITDGGTQTTIAIADCLDYLRARVGVPRDMSHPAAQELRTELRRVSAALRVVSAV